MFEKENRRRIIKKPVVIILFIMLMVALAGCSGETVATNDRQSSTAGAIIETNQNPVNGMVQSDDGGSVTIDIEWIGLENDALVLNVTMNTHTVDLDSYDLGELAILRDDEGNEYRASSWEAAAGGHHRRGVIHFPIPDSLTEGTADYMEMVIHDIAGIDERVLKWNLR